MSILQVLVTQVKGALGVHRRDRRTIYREEEKKNENLKTIKSFESGLERLGRA